jgi:hypothetical protein
VSQRSALAARAQRAAAARGLPQPHALQPSHKGRVSLLQLKGSEGALEALQLALCLHQPLGQEGVSGGLELGVQGLLH